MKIDLRDNWKFRRLGEPEYRIVRVPHDAMIEEKRDPNCESKASGAYFPGGIYEYIQELDVPADWKNKKVSIEFQGGFRKTAVYVNENQVGEIVYGYTEGLFDISDALIAGQVNTIRVVAKNDEQPNSRWYTGSGIYRPVTLYVQEQEHIAVHGVRVSTVSIDPAVIAVASVCTKAKNTDTIVKVFDAAGKLAAEGQGNELRLTIPDANLWSPENPYLYRCEVTLCAEGRVIDSVSENVGIRTITWCSKGLFINGQETYLKGGCIHHDNGVLGARSFPAAEERKVRIMKEYGFNAIRSSHNPCSRAMLDACDRLGIMVMDETWDMWYQHKSKYDYAENFLTYYRDDIRRMVEKDFNHPSVIMYSIGNEISEPAKEKGMILAQEMIDYFHILDASRPVSAGLNLMIVSNAAKGMEMYNADGGVNMDTASGIGGNSEAGQEQAFKMPEMSKMDSTMFNMMTQSMGAGMNHCADSEEADRATTPILDALDIAGYNYASGRYPLEGEAHPNRVIFGSETFPQDIGKNWAMVKKYPYLVGDFMWTAWDYLGESGIGVWSYSMDAMSFDKPYPWLTGGAGVIDLIGHPDGEALYADVVWSEDMRIHMAVTPANHPGQTPFKSAWRGTNAIPSWAWKGCEGNPVSVECYTQAPQVKLYLNGELLGQMAVSDSKAVFEIDYHPGTLTAEACAEDGGVLDSCTLTSAEGELQICIRQEAASAVDPKIRFLEIDICGENGVPESNADRLLQVKTEGCELLAFGSARQKTEESFVDAEETSYHGRTLAVVYLTAPESGITVSADGLVDQSQAIR